MRGATPGWRLDPYVHTPDNYWIKQRECIAWARRNALCFSLSVSPYLFLYFLLFFVLGFLIYATLYAAIGSTAESASDVQQVAFPVTMLLVVPFILLQGVVQNPSGTGSVILSMIPFFAPILMLGRIFTETPPWWQIVITVVIMIGTFFGCLWVAARIYRVGILMYGKKFKPREILKWIKYT